MAMKTNLMRTPGEIRSAFEARGCTVIERSLGDSYRAGGEVFILAPGITLAGSEGKKFAKADFSTFDGTGYDGRGRHSAVWIVTAGDMIPCTAAEFANCAESERVAFGAEHKSCGNQMWFCLASAKAAKGLSDFGSAFAALGL